MTERLPFADGIRAVLFDAGNTLLWIDHARIAALLAECGIACDEASVRSAEMRARPRLDPLLRAAVKRESAEMVRRYAREILDGAAPHHAEARLVPAIDALLAAWPTLWTRPPADAHATLASLAARGFVLGVVSNANGTVARLLDDAGLGTHLRCVVDSGCEGVEKPDPRIFRRASERIGVAPAHCVYVGDYLSLDVEGARGAGMHGVLMDPEHVWDAPGVPRVRSLAELASRL